VRPSGGRIRFEDQDLLAVAPAARAHFGIAHVPEGRQVFAGMTVMENLEMGAYPQSGRQAWAHNLERIFALFPILAERRGQAAGTLSGGEQQMVAMGRALMARPKLLCMDEPSMGLSPAYVEQVFDIIRTINEQGVTIFMVEQNANMALSIADHAYVLQTGHVVLSGPAAELRQTELIRHAYLGELKVA
jgi:branched-chain amino acid transport system ATP-binding protein